MLRPRTERGRVAEKAGQEHRPCRLPRLPSIVPRSGVAMMLPNGVTRFRKGMAALPDTDGVV
jgi:hypothetical protein